MKRFIGLLSLSFLSILSINAQTITCNAEFGINYQTSNTVQFNPVMTGTTPGTIHQWIFGDGNTSTAIQPIHVYNSSGNFISLHIVTKISPNGIELCRDTFNRVIHIDTVCNLTASFITLPANTPNTVHFTNTSSPANPNDSCRWTFGDGTSSGGYNTSHTYAQPGTYNVCLRIIKRNSNGTLTNCIREVCHTVTIPGTSCVLTANFITQPGTTPNSVQFINTSQPVNPNDSCRWTFGDGTSSGGYNTSHTYAQPGTYNVCLRIIRRNPNGTLSDCIREVCHTVTIPGTSCVLTANFISQLSTTNPNTVLFSNTSQPANTNDSCRWTFGDGTSSGGYNTIHTYSQPGTYNVCLRIIKRNSNGTLTNCIREICHTVSIPGTGCVLTANFITQPTSTNTNTIHFINTSQPVNTTDSCRWTFGDGTSSGGYNTIHTYSQPGTYNVCLRIIKRNSNGTLTNCIREICHTVTVGGNINCNTAVVSFTYHNDPVQLNKYYFLAVSNVPLATQTWTITKLPATSTVPPVVINQNNPYYVFNDTGNYRICLRAVTSNGCIKEYCQVIHIGPIVQPGICNMVVYPNPVTSVINANLFLTQPLMLHAYIFNSSSVQVMQAHQQGFAGTNIISMLTGNLSAGNYTIKVIYGNNLCTRHFIKL